jgi:hypothetical protein
MLIPSRSRTRRVVCNVTGAAAAALGRAKEADHGRR